MPASASEGSAQKPCGHAQEDQYASQHEGNKAAGAGLSIGRRLGNPEGVHEGLDQDPEGIHKQSDAAVRRVDAVFGRFRCIRRGLRPI